MFGGTIEELKEATQVVTETAIASAAGNADLLVQKILGEVTTTVRGLLSEQDGWTIEVIIPRIIIPSTTITVRLNKPK